MDTRITLRLLTDGLLVLAGTDRSLAPNPLERAMIQGLCSERQISRRSHNHHTTLFWTADADENR